MTSFSGAAGHGASGAVTYRPRDLAHAGGGRPAAGREPGTMGRCGDAGAECCV